MMSGSATSAARRPCALALAAKVAERAGWRLRLGPRYPRLSASSAANASTRHPQS
ncbi:MAG: hypothetical protein WKG07_25540 [Hymenobacter sp.]